VEAPALTELVGASAPRVTMLSWMLGSSFAALAGILLAPFTGLDAVLLTLLVIQAFGAAAIGRLTSLPGAYVGGLVIGVGAALATKLVAGRPALAGLPSSLPFIVLFAVLVLSRKGAFSEVTGESRAAGRAMPRLRGAGRPGARSFPLRAVLLATAGAVLLPFVLNNARLVTATTTLVFVLILASLGLLVGTARMVSLSHVAFVALGATVLARLLEAGVPYVAALVLAGLLVVPAGALVAIPAIRLSGLFLALATFGFAILAQTLLFPTEWGFGADSTVALPRPGGFQSETAFYYLVLAVVVAGIVAIEAVRVTRLGRMLRALADSPTAVESIGLKPTVSLVLLFCLCAFLAAVAGGLLGSITQLITPSGFDFTQSLIWLAVLVTAGASTFGGSVLAAVFLVAIPAVAESPVVTEYFPVVFGVAAILLAQARNGLVGLLAPPDFAALAQRDQWRLARSRHAARLRLARDAA
ncbi:MAG TPA: hypothetical protein VFS16_17535, partial [Acidimicrobiia bacterium]|nr:hypothetical protein [Acidimicrobiia bacterium]